jgi:anti-sigma28 factor (negative regulator of flagellin synthesis)
MQANDENTGNGQTGALPSSQSNIADIEGAPLADDDMTTNQTSAVSGSEAMQFQGAAGRTKLDPAKLAEIRQKILDGAYNSLESVEQVARRILASGDL